MRLMFQRNYFLTVVSAVTVLLLMAGPVRAKIVVTIDDDFDDGNIATNTTGTGTGFTKYETRNWVNEAGSLVTVKGDGANRSSIESKESVNATLARAEVLFRFEGVQFTVTGTTDNNYNGKNFTGVRMKAPAGYTYNVSTLGHGFYVQYETDIWSGWSGTSRFWYINELNEETVLATWEFDTLDLLNAELDGDGHDVTPVLDVAITLTANTWALDITGDTQGGGSPISFSGMNDFGGDNNHGVTNGHAFIYNQSYAPATYTECDRILVRTFSEPGMVLMIR